MKTRINYDKHIKRIRKDAEDAIYWLDAMRWAKNIEDKYQFLNNAIVSAEGWTHGELSKIEEKLYREMKEREKK